MMCTTCGCGIGQTLINGKPLHKPRQHGGPMHFRAHEADTHIPDVSASRIVKLEQDLLAKNDGYAEANRHDLAAHGIFALNLVSSPGSGKTTLLVKTIEALNGQLKLAVIEGDQQTDNDAARIRATGAPALQINTGKGCHLDAYMVGKAMTQLQLAEDSLLLIENVGNLVCPSSFDLGEAHKVAILSVTEGEDKPLKYPDMFAAADVMLCIEYARFPRPVLVRIGQGGLLRRFADPQVLQRRFTTRQAHANLA